MSVIAFFLKYLFVVAMLVAFFLIGIVTYLYLRIKRMTQAFHNGNRRHSAQQSTASGAQKRRSTQYDDGVTVEEELYDQRSAKQANRKIFAKDEGEYVDFEEEK